MKSVSYSQLFSYSYSSFFQKPVYPLIQILMWIFLFYKVLFCGKMKKDAGMLLVFKFAI